MCFGENAKETTWAVGRYWDCGDQRGCYGVGGGDWIRGRWVGWHSDVAGRASSRRENVSSCGPECGRVNRLMDCENVQKNETSRTKAGVIKN